MANLLALLYVMFLVFLSLSHLGQVWYLIASIPDLFLLPYFDPEFIYFLLLRLSQVLG